MLLYANGSVDADISIDVIREAVQSSLRAFGKPRNILIIPPDITRLPSRAGQLTECIYELYPDAVKAILPSLGTHLPMQEAEIKTMFGKVPTYLFKNHNWRNDCREAGIIPADFVSEVSEGVISYDIPVSVNKTLFDRAFDCIFSISQVVPHEVAGMAGYTKNIIVGLGGVENIHKTHFLGAVYGMEKIMGRADTPVRKVLNHAFKKFLGRLPFIHAITVIGSGKDGIPKMRGLYIGNDDECYKLASELSRKVNIHIIDKPLRKVVVYLAPGEYRSTWLGNKSIYRTRMAIADGGELVVIAPGVKMFGEDGEIDALIRKFGYRGTPAILSSVKDNARLAANLSAAAHLIHGSSEGRFSITYCTAGLSKEEIESAGFRYKPLEEIIVRYNPETLKEGYNRMPDGEEIFYISKPGAGLWAWKEKFYC